MMVGSASVGATLVPIPNTTVKPHSADGTAGPPVGEYVAASLTLKPPARFIDRQGASSLAERRGSEVGTTRVAGCRRAAVQEMTSSAKRPLKLRDHLHTQVVPCQGRRAGRLRRT